jgi:4-hydroxy-tetrahydrodipicolinate synthase
MNPAPRCRGLGVALVTPFGPDGNLDHQALARLVQHTDRGGAQFVVVLGSTGEAATLTEPERDAAIATVLAHRGRQAVWVGTGSSATAQAVAWTRRAQQLGAHGALVVTPPYNKPSQRGLCAHFRAVAAAAPELPILLYNVPSRTGGNLLPATLAELWREPNLIGIKESSGDLTQIGRIAAELPPGKLLLAGDDALALPTLALGGHGLISVAGNVAPEAVERLIATALQDPNRARALHQRLLPLFDTLFVEPNPVPAKAALDLLGLCSDAVRLPLLPAEPTTRERLRRCLQTLGLLQLAPPPAAGELHHA